eukprot:GHVR01164372.1.p1 GENE.GHVR01164372.1~~GHVR01164372.1.p1  ORF type:complete len:253 (+),score=114.73 GHVR01164372.1:208-966(+)
MQTLRRQNLLPPVRTHTHTHGHPQINPNSQSYGNSRTQPLFQPFASRFTPSVFPSSHLQSLWSLEKRNLLEKEKKIESVLLCVCVEVLEIILMYMNEKDLSCLQATAPASRTLVQKFTEDNNMLRMTSGPLSMCVCVCMHCPEERYEWRVALPDVPQKLPQQLMQNRKAPGVFVFPQPKAGVLGASDTRPLSHTHTHTHKFKVGTSNYTHTHRQAVEDENTHTHTHTHTGDTLVSFLAERSAFACVWWLWCV